MAALPAYVGLSLRLNARNRMALAYGYLFPLIFLVAFATLYRAEPRPLALHLGELLTVTIIGGACFGLPTTMVSERERGVWRRYRATPTPARLFVAGVFAARLVLLATAALLQLALGLLLGMPVPAHPLALALAFGVAAAAFIGLGLVIAMLADSVVAVQALGQCLFLPMLMIGGVAVRLASLPPWAQHLSAFFPGRYAVAAIQSGADAGVSAIGFPLAALAAIGVAAAAAALLMFRWDASPRAIDRRRRGWLLLALAGWAAVGVVAERRGAVLALPPVAEERSTGREFLRAAPPPSGRPAQEPAALPPPIPRPRPLPATPTRSRTWQTVTAAEMADVAYNRLPPDQGIVAPIATVDEALPPPLAEQYDAVAQALPGWGPGKAADPVQRARNLLYVAAVPDALRMSDLERFLPVLVYGRLRAEFGRDDLARILYWIATHPNDGDASAAHDLAAIGLPETTVPDATTRTRAMLYAFKLLGRVTGAIVQR